MAQFLPFIGTRYHSTYVNVTKVVSPPYDVISPAYRDQLYDRDPHNVIRLELNRESDPYTAAQNEFREWLGEGIIERDVHSQFYVYYQRFNDPEGREYTREGVLGRLRLTPYSEKQVLPHERTLAGPKRDRLKLLETMHANVSPIFGLIDDKTMIFDHTLEAAAAQLPLADVDEILENGEHVRHTMWKLDDPHLVSRLTAIMQDQQVIIADGHHRYETSLAYAQAHPDESGAQFILIFISNLRAEGTVILPTHRVLHSFAEFDAYKAFEKLKENFELAQYDRREDAYQALLGDQQAVTMIELNESPRFSVVRQKASGSGSALERLPVQVLQEKILKGAIGLTQDAIDNKTNLLYPHSLEERDTMAAAQATQATFYLRPVQPAEMAAVVDEGDFMPQKSTFFYPKLLTGLVFHEFEVQPSGD